MCLLISNDKKSQVRIVFQRLIDKIAKEIYFFFEKMNGKQVLTSFRTLRKSAYVTLL